jgi:hypothetical protein
MADDVYDKLSQEPTEKLVERRGGNEEMWERWDRKSDPRGEYTARQYAIEQENAVIDRILRERAVAPKAE